MIKILGVKFDKTVLNEAWCSDVVSFNPVMKWRVHKSMLMHHRQIKYCANKALFDGVPTNLHITYQRVGDV